MSHHVAVCGVATPTGLYARCGDGWRKLEPTRTPIVALTPLGLAVREARDGILRGDVEPCACGQYACEEHVTPDADPHGDLSVFSKYDLSY